MNGLKNTRNIGIDMNKQDVLNFNLSYKDKLLGNPYKNQEDNLNVDEMLRL